MTIFHDFFAFVLFESCEQLIRNITASYQVMSSNPNIVYICFPYRNLGSLGDGGDSHVFCLVHCYVLCSSALSTNNNKKPPRSRVSFRNTTKHHFCSLASKLPPLQLPMHPELRLSSLSVNYYINTNFFSLSRLYLWQGFESCFVLYYHIRSFPGPNLYPLSLWI